MKRPIQIWLIVFLTMSCELLCAQAEGPQAQQQLLVEVEDAYFARPVSEATLKLYQRWRSATGAWQRSLEGEHSANREGQIPLLLQAEVSYLLVTEAEGYYLNHTPYRCAQADTVLRSFALSLRPKDYRPVLLRFELESEAPLPDSTYLSFRYLADSNWQQVPLDPKGEQQLYFPEGQSHYLRIEHPDIVAFQDSLYVETALGGPYAAAPSLEASFQLQIQAPSWAVGDTLPLADLYFQQGSEQRLNSDDWPALREWLDSYGQQPLTLEVHTDARGSDRKNRLLAEARIEELRQLLENWGIDLQRIAFEAVGEARLFNHCKDGVACSEAEHQENNRLLVRVGD